MIVPPDLQDGILAARRAADLHPQLLDQAVLADFIVEGHFERHLRRMREAYRARLEALVEATKRHCAGGLRLHVPRMGLHAVADLEEADAERVYQEATARGVEVTPLSIYYFGRGTPANGLVLGFGPARPDAVGRGMARLADAIEAARRR
jgi:GntR family transcriptional regulator/MocR family aminotransferase